MQFATERLILKAATPELSCADLEDRKRFAQLLEAAVPDDWPPEIFDDAARHFFTKQLELQPGDAGWWHWYLVVTDPVPTLVGTGGFGGGPDANGTIVTGYSLLPAHQGRGYGTEAVAALVTWAFREPAVRCIAAETYSHLLPSIRLLEKLAFRPAGAGETPGTLRFERLRTE
ncbi:MAG: GNAT family N-acetyltransferase [Candidatus Eremiobacteraeota bacterium]|nr:GNAT family N-acetyltransferase [Candidatus Eremiobacteraeota bacterium]